MSLEGPKSCQTLPLIPPPAKNSQNRLISSHYLP
jgi:hypothetical protein